MLNYLKANDILSNEQFGFLRGRSTVLQLLKVVDKWMEIMDKGGVIDVIYCVFQKAFDTVPHKRFLEILIRYGITDPVLSWVQDFLSNRRQQILVNGCKSEIFEVISGVPQGSVLGPLLFIIYINSMIDKTGSLDLFLYADDLKIYNEINTDEDVEALQQDLDRRYGWTQYSLLKFHPGKYVDMCLKSKFKNNEPNCFYNMDQTKLKNVNTENDLGIIFDDKLSFEEHINNKVKKANSIAGMLRRSFVHLDKDMFKKLFTSMVRPHLEYGAPIWNPHTKKNIDAIENVQRRASKRIPGLSHLTYKQRLETIELPTLQYRRYRGDMIETYKMSHGLYEEAIRDFLHFQPNDSRGYNFRGHS